MSEDKPQQQQPPKDRTVQFNQYLNKRCHITFGGSRSVVGIIVGWDSLNLVIDDANESRSFHDGPNEVEYSRKLGQIIVRAQQISSIFPDDGYEPYIAPVADDSTANITVAQ